MHQFIKFILFWNDTLHVLDGLSVHPSSSRLYIQQQAYVTKILLSACYQVPASKTERLSETCRVSFQNKIKFDTLVHVVGFTTEISIIIFISFHFFIEIHRSLLVHDQDIEYVYNYPITQHINIFATYIIHYISI